MMTTMAALMGTLPIAIGAGAGAESRRPLGVAVVGGLAFSQLITLYVTPVFYTYLDALQRRFERSAKRNEARAQGQAPGRSPSRPPATDPRRFLPDARSGLTFSHCRGIGVCEPAAFAMILLFLMGRREACDPRNFRDIQ